jgi:hypothetical protein
MLLLDARSRPLPTNVVRGAGTTRVVWLAPGQTASSLLHWTVVPGVDEASPSTPCEPRPSRLEVTPPDETTQLFTGWSMAEVCFHGRIDTSSLDARVIPF